MTRFIEIEGLKYKSQLNKVVKTLLLSTALVYPSFGFAAEKEQTVTAEAENALKKTFILEEIIVTATKRSEPLMNIPQSITALTDENLKNLSADNFSGYARHVPSLDFVEFSPGQTRITVRGVSAEEGISTTGYYIDEIAVTSAAQGAQPDFRLFDVERVEVLRGPQGTLYGEGSMGGTVRVITKKPDLKKIEGEVDVSGAKIDAGGEDYSANAMLNIPLVEGKVALRAVGGYRNFGGWIDNIYPGQEQTDTNAGTSYSGRVSLLLQPTEALSITGSVMINRLHTDNNNVTNVGTDVSYAALNPRDDDYNLYGLTLNYEFDGATLTSATSYTNRDSARRFTDQQAALDFFNGGFFFPITNGAYELSKSLVFLADKSNNFTEEVRLASNAKSRLRWTLGAYYRVGNSTSLNYRVTTPDFTFGPGNLLDMPAGTPVPGGIFSADDKLHYKTLAFFGEATYALTDQVDATLGMRWFEERTKIESQISGAFVYSPSYGFVAPADTDSSKNNNITPKASLSYHPNANTLAYVTVARGYRAGGANLLAGVIPAAQDRYKPDTTINYEVGGKFTMLDGRMTVTGALYYIDWKDLQVFDFDTNLGLGFVSNAGKAHSQGLELEIVTHPTDRLTLTLSGNLTEAELDVDIPGANYSVDGSLIHKGSRLPNVPKYKMGAVAEYNFPINSKLNGVIIGDVSFVGDSYSRMEAGVNAGIGYGNSHQRAYGIGNLRTGVQADNWTFQVFVTNIWNQVADLGDDNFGGFHRNQPRAIGADLNFKF